MKIAILGGSFDPPHLGHLILADTVITNCNYDKIILPVRATAGSAGYDIVTPQDVTLNPGESIRIPTGIRVRM